MSALHKPHNKKVSSLQCSPHKQQPLSHSPEYFVHKDFIDRVRRSEPQAITLLVQTYTKQLYRQCLGLGLNQQEAQDLVQNTWLSFFEGVHRFQGKSHLRTYLFGILYNKFREYLRDKQKHQKHIPLEEVSIQQYDESGRFMHIPLSPEKFELAAETMQILRECLNKLTSNQRMAFYLKIIDGEETSDICRIMKISATNLGVLLFRARNHLRASIEKKYLMQKQKK